MYKFDPKRKEDIFKFLMSNTNDDGEEESNDNDDEKNKKQKKQTIIFISIPKSTETVFSNLLNTFANVNQTI